MLLATSLELVGLFEHHVQSIKKRLTELNSYTIGDKTAAAMSYKQNIDENNDKIGI